MDRKVFLQRLLDSRFNGSQAEFARAIKRSPAQVNQWLNGYRTLGNAGARHIELTLALSAGWLDGATESSSEISLSPYKRELLSLFDSLPQSEQDNLMNSLKEKKQYYDKRVEELLAAKEPQVRQQAKSQSQSQSQSEIGSVSDAWEAEGIIGDLSDLKSQQAKKSKKAG